MTRVLLSAGCIYFDYACSVCVMSLDASTMMFQHFLQSIWHGMHRTQQQHLKKNPTTSKTYRRERISKESTVLWNICMIRKERPSQTVQKQANYIGRPGRRNYVKQSTARDWCPKVWQDIGYIWSQQVHLNFRVNLLRVPVPHSLFLKPGAYLWFSVGMSWICLFTIFIFHFPTKVGFQSSLQ